MGGELIVSDDAKRGAMTEARKIRIWNRENGICRICKKPVPHKGPGVRYDHYSPFWISRDDSDENLFPLHTACDAEKTYKADLPTISKIKRQSRKFGVDFDPEAKKPSRLRGRGFDKTKKRTFSGKVVERRK